MQRENPSSKPQLEHNKTKMTDSCLQAYPNIILICSKIN